MHLCASMSPPANHASATNHLTRSRLANCSLYRHQLRPGSQYPWTSSPVSRPQLLVTTPSSPLSTASPSRATSSPPLLHVQLSMPPLCSSVKFIGIMVCLPPLFLTETPGLRPGSGKLCSPTSAPTSRCLLPTTQRLMVSQNVPIALLRRCCVIMCTRCMMTGIATCQFWSLLTTTASTHLHITLHSS